MQIYFKITNKIITVVTTNVDLSDNINTLNDKVDYQISIRFFKFKKGK